MKISIFIGILLPLIFISCKKENTHTAVSAGDVESASGVQGAVNYTHIVPTSEISWRGYKFFEQVDSTSGHYGFMKFKTASAGIKDGKLVSGSFLADVSSLESVDLNDNKEYKDKLDGHLKSEDFLAVEKHPTASFVITKVKELQEGDYNTEISGNLMIKDLEKNISFRANVEVSPDQVSIFSEEFSILRDDFNITYDGTIENGLIKEEFSLQISLEIDK